ncbi:MAG TPA: acetate--CoA ligase family protein [Vicinamibacterales bacterium]|nr:acetate--CoA ligase family protein [Vicinamibacterales bacterium]
MLPDLDAIARLVADAHARGDAAIVGADAMAMAAAIGVPSPASLTLASADAVARADLSSLGDRVVIKAISPRLVHKSDAGGVRVVENARARVAEAVGEMAQRLAEYAPTFLVSAYVPHGDAFGDELILGARWTPDFGAVVTAGAGGIATEFVAANLRRDRRLAIVSPSLPAVRSLGDRLRASAAIDAATQPCRGDAARVSLAALEDAVARLGAAASRFADLGVSEFEINPLVSSGGALVALDARAIFGRPVAPAVARPLRKLRHLLTPARIAIVGVSSDMNPGRVIVRNLLREGFGAEHITIIKPGVEHIDGCRCVATLAAMAQEADLLVLAVPAATAASFVVEAIRNKAAESIIVIPGGFEEKRTGAPLAAEVRSALDRARRTPWGGPVLNGANCIGVRSKPGKYDTTFIPEDRLPAERAPEAPVAVIAQSGAFALTLLNKLPHFNPTYLVTVGNQIDLTIGDYLAYLKDDASIDLFAVYVEGFKPLDGAAFVDAAAAIVASGRTVVLYAAGRTPAGARATSSHTASMAGDAEVTRALARQAGILVADSLADFEDLVKLFTMLRDRRVGGRRLGAVTNAGFECVAVADSLGALALAPFTRHTIERLQALVKLARVDGLVDVHNPLDVTPMMGDVTYDEIVRAVLADPTVDVGVVGCVPMTPALNTVPLRPAPTARTDEPVFGADSIVTHLAAIAAEARKAWIAVVDAGSLYDPMAARLEAAGIPVFRTADRALPLFDVFCAERLRRRANDRHSEDHHEDTVVGAVRAANAGDAPVGGA